MMSTRAVTVEEGEAVGVKNCVGVRGVGVRTNSGVGTEIVRVGVTGGGGVGVREAAGVCRSDSRVTCSNPVDNWITPGGTHPARRMTMLVTNDIRSEEDRQRENFAYMRQLPILQGKRSFPHFNYGKLIIRGRPSK